MKPAKDEGLANDRIVAGQVTHAERWVRQGESHSTILQARSMGPHNVSARPLQYTIH
jgi:hypothetical protein